MDKSNTSIAGLWRWIFALAAVAVLVGCSGSTCNPVLAAKRTLESLSIGPPFATLAAGSVQQYVVTAVYSDGTKETLPASQITWATSNASAATLLPTLPGKANTVSAGVTTITATLDGITTTTVLTVTPAVLVSIEVTPTTPQVPAGVNEPFKATGVYSDGSTQDLTSAVTWSSAAAGVATVSNTAGSSGVAATVAAGSAQLSATLNGITGSTTLIVTPPTLVSIAVTAASATLPKGLTQPYTATGTYSDGTHQDLTASVAWTSATPTAAGIGAGGLATAVGLGSTSVIATLGNISGSLGLTVTAPTLKSIGVTPANASVPKGTQPQFTAVGTFSDGSTAVITQQAVWTSSNTAVAPVSNAGSYSGLATALTTGTATLTATYQGAAGSAGLTVTAAVLQSIEVTPSHPSLASGTTDALTATGIYTDGTTRDLTQTATWSSATPATATVSNATGTQGLVTAAALGTTTVTATQGGVSGSTPVTVTAATLRSILVTPATASIAKGTSQSFTATGTYSDNSTHDITTAVTWSSSAPAVATVSNAGGSNGVAAALTLGTSTITAALGSVSASGALTVTAATLTSITVTPANPSVPKGNSQAFVATGTYSDQSTQNLTTSVTWSSSATSVATVSNVASSNGVASTLAVGATTITATQGGISGSTGLTVSAAALVSIAVTPANATVFVGNTQAYTAIGTYTDGSTADITASASTVWNSSNVTAGTESNANGTQGVLTPLAAAATTITATANGISGTTTATVATREYGYIALDGANPGSIAPYLVGNSGALTALGSGAVNSGGTQPFAIAIDGSRNDMYVTNIQSNNIQQFTIAANGSLTAGTLYNTNLANPAFMSFDKNRNFLYVANLAGGPGGTGYIAQYSVGGGGALTYLGLVATGFSVPFDLAIDPSNRWLYVLGANSGTVAQYSVASNGLLTYVASIVIPGGGSSAVYIPEIIAIDPAGTHAYVSAQYANANTPSGHLGEVMEYSIDQTTGALTLVNSLDTGVYSRSVVLDPTATHVYVANVYSGTISVFSVTGAGLQPLTTVTTGSGVNSQPVQLNLDPTGQYVYASLKGDNTVAQYSINADGTLHLIGVTSTGVGSQPGWVATGN